jgi:hypothetical protein
MNASEYVGSFGIEPQNESETSQAFKERVAGTLRDNNRIIEAHEVIQGKRYDDPEGGDVMSGIMGAMSMAFNNVDYGSSGNSQIGDDIAAGIVANAPKKKSASIEAMMLMVEMMGRK